MGGAGQRKPPARTKVAPGVTGMRPEDVYALTSVGDPRLSPDGRRVAYVVNRIDRESNSYRSPRWSPDGRWLAFVSNRDGEEKKAHGELYVLPADGGEPRRLTDGQEGVESTAWSSDSLRIAFARRVRDDAYGEEDEQRRPPRRFTRVYYKLDNVGWTGDRRRHLFVVGLDGGDERQLTDGDCENDEPAWSPA